MTAQQVAYWQLQEAKRHNFQEESLKSDIQEAQKQRYLSQNATDLLQANASTSNASTNKKKLGADYISAIGNLFKGVSSIVSSASSASRNAKEMSMLFL